MTRHVLSKVSIVVLAGVVGAGSLLGVSSAQTATSSAAPPACAASFDPNPAPVGSTIRATVSGFDPDEPVGVTITGLAPFTASANAEGIYSFTATATPANAGQSFTYTFTGQRSGITCTATSTEDPAPVSTNAVTVAQRVIGTAPATTTFTLLFSCDGSPGAPTTTAVEFDASGQAQGTNQFAVPADTSCVVTQQGTAGATSWTYQCAYTPGADDPDGSGGSCTSPTGNTVQFHATVGAHATITVVSTFALSAARPVSVGPTFTG
jgi:hypothetical protein